MAGAYATMVADSEVVKVLVEILTVRAIAADLVRQQT